MEAMVKSIPVYYEEYGAGTPILIIHGAQVDHNHMVADLEPLFQNRPGWRRIYPDLPGHGKTPAAEWITSMDHFLEIMTEFMQTVASNHRFVVVGVSRGAYLARGLIYKQGATIDGLFLEVPVIEADLSKQQTPLQQVLVENPQFQAAWPPEENALRSLVVVQNNEIAEWFRTFLHLAGSLVDYNFLMKVNEQFTFPVDQLTIPFPAPTLILTGHQDSICGYNDAWVLLENYPRGTFAVLDWAGHFLRIEQPALFQALVNEWLNRVEEYIAKTVKSGKE